METEGEGGVVHVNLNLSRVSERYHTKGVGKEIVAKPKIGMCWFVFVFQN